MTRCFASFRARISFFHFSSRPPVDRGLDDLYPSWSCAHCLAVYRCLVELRRAAPKFSAPDGAAPPVSRSSSWKRSRRWCNRARPSGGAPPTRCWSKGADAGAEQWYLTIAKLMRGRNSNPHEPSKRTSGPVPGASTRRHRSQPISSELPG